MAVLAVAAGVIQGQARHDVRVTGQKFATPSAMKLHAGDKNPAAHIVIDTKSTNVDGDASIYVVVGTKDHKRVSEYIDSIPQQPESYYMSIGKEKVVIAASDESGAAYGMQAFVKMLEGDSLQCVEIRETPDVRLRGVVEGFYGTPWSHEARRDMMRFMKKHRMNVYLYGPKDDVYHRARWSEPYPEKEAAQIRDLVNTANENNLTFYWAIHPGADITWDGSERQKIVDKFNLMYDLGVRGFAVFLDDIRGKGTDPSQQVPLLNYIHDEFIAKKPDVAPLVMCPTMYTQSWNENNPGYLNVLKEGLNPDIMVMWTGRTVMSDIDKPTMEWINREIGRKAFVWWNFPVSDYVRDKVVLGPAYGISTDIADDLGGFAVNPMEYSEASKIAIGAVGEYLWDMQSYDPDVAWRKSIAELCPGAPGAFEEFAAFCQSTLPNWENFDRVETPELTEVAERALQGDTEALNEISRRCVGLKNAALILLADSSNPVLIEEIRPWLQQAVNIADYGILACHLSSEGSNPEDLKVLDAMRVNIANHEQRGRNRETQTGIRLGTAVLMPTLTRLHARLKGVEITPNDHQKAPAVPEWQVLTR